jgi:hypothetical protein
MLYIRDTYGRFVKVLIRSKEEGVFVIRASVIWKRDSETSSEKNLTLVAKNSLSHI